MALTPVEFPSFGGVDLRSDPQTVSGSAAVDAMNIDMDLVGRIRSRDGYAAFLSGATASRITQLFPFYNTSGARHIVACYGTTVQAFNSTNSSVATVLSGNTSVDAAFFGGTLGERLYITNTVDAVGYYDGSAFTTSAYSGTTLKCNHLAVQSTEGRLVGAGTPTDGTNVLFSAAGDPQTFPTNNFVRLDPGDGTIIEGISEWQNVVIVFKPNKFYVFYGNSVDGSGNSVFNYRPIATGIGLAQGARRAVASSPLGVFFLNERGIYRTTGGAPELVSRAITPLFSGNLSPYVGFSALNTSQIALSAMTWMNDRLYVAIPTGSSTFNNMLLVWDSILDSWFTYDIAASCLTPFNVSSTTLFFGYATGANQIGNHSSASTTDAGTAIASRYRTGFWNPGQPGAESVVREWLIDGTGTITVKTAVNDAVTLGTGASVTLGTSPAIAQGRDRRAVRGRNVSLELSGSGQWAVSRVISNLRGQRSSALKAT